MSVISPLTPNCQCADPEEEIAFPDSIWKIISTLGSHKNTGMDPLHPIHRSNGIPSVKYNYGK